MSQLFTLQFPKYHFDQQREFTITFPNASSLPFTYEITNRMVCVDRMLNPTEEEQHNAELKKKRRYWKYMGLQEGVRIIKINEKDLTDDDDRKQKEKQQIKLIREDIDEMIRQHTRQHTNDDKSIDITFREEILEFDDSISLGLTWKKDTNYQQDTTADFEEAKSSPTSKSMQLLGITKAIKNNQIGASSCAPGYEPTECRLNNPSSCWKPSKQDSKLNNSWIGIDLKQKRMITKIRLQGAPQNKAYIKSFWIDHSDDGSEWKCHNTTDSEIECNYKQTTTENNMFGVDDSDDIKSGNDKCAEIGIWPPIHARFIRLRPCDYFNEIALRFDIYGPAKSRLEYARVIKFGDLSEEGRHEALRKIKHVTSNSRIIQVDCRAVLRNALNEAKMSYVGFVETDKNNYLCVFSTADLAATEKTIEELMNVGIGRAMGVAGICPMQFRRPTKQVVSTKDEEEEKNKDFQSKHGVTAGFYASIKSRQIVDQLVDNTTQSAEFTYDYMSMLLVADVIAAMGLGTNSAVIVVASMLVSPIMGPVLALTFGVHLRKFKFAKALAKLGLKNEIWSLLICILVGFIVGFVLISATKNESNTPWPTSEMYGRGQVSGLATGAIVAFASGVGVALSVVGDYMATVIGVAISASLLPPAVNCGMLWAMSLYVYIWPDRGCHPNYGDAGDGGYCFSPQELGFMGTISIVLTIENIILVFLASWMMFIVKDVAIGKDRGYDDQNRQLVYQSITSFKDRYDDIKVRSSSFNLKRAARGPSMKRLEIKGKSKQYLGKSLKNLTVDTDFKDRTLKKSLMQYNTLRGGGGTDNARFDGNLFRAQTELDGIMEDEDEEYFESTDDFGGGSKIRLSGLDINVQRVKTGSMEVLTEENEINEVNRVNEIEEDEPLVTDTNVNVKKDANKGYVEMAQHDDDDDDDK